MAWTTDICCSLLEGTPSFNLAYPNSTAYQATENLYWSLQEASLTPACIVTPTTPEDVAEIVGRLAGTGSCQFAIKSGAHAPAAGFANINGGVTLDLRLLSSVSLSADGSVASVGAGARWLDVYTALDPHNRTVAGGRNGHVGVGGLTLGGGISYFGAEVGWTCDTVVNAEVVLADGRVVQANASNERADLWRALKGGMGNFGVVTRWDFATVELGEILGGLVVNDIAEREAVWRAFTNLANSSVYDVHASLVTSPYFTVAEKEWVVLNIPAYTLPELRPAVYDELFAVPNISDSLYITSLAPYSDEKPIALVNQGFSTGTYDVSATLMEKMFQICNDSVYNTNIASLETMSIVFETFPSLFPAHGAGTNSLGTTGAEGNGFIILVSPQWTSPSDNDAVQNLLTSMQRDFDAVAQEMGLLREFRYPNYAGPTQQPIEHFGEANVQFLHDVAWKYDPTAVFQRQVPGGFKLDEFGYGGWSPWHA